MTVAWFISQKHSDQRVSTLWLSANHMDSACFLHIIMQGKVQSNSRPHQESLSPLCISCTHDRRQLRGRGNSRIMLTDDYDADYRWNEKKLECQPDESIKLPCKHMKMNGQGHLNSSTRALDKNWHTETAKQAAQLFCEA